MGCLNKGLLAATRCNYIRSAVFNTNRQRNPLFQAVQCGAFRARLQAKLDCPSDITRREEIEVSSCSLDTLALVSSSPIRRRGEQAMNRLDFRKVSTATTSTMTRACRCARTFSSITPCQHLQRQPKDVPPEETAALILEWQIDIAGVFLRKYRICCFDRGRGETSSSARSLFPALMSSRSAEHRASASGPNALLAEGLD